MKTVLAVARPIPEPDEDVFDIFLQPFNKLSPFRRPMGTGAQYAGDTHAMTTAWNRLQFNGVSTNNSFGFNVYRNSASDPLRTIIWYGGGGGHANLPITVRAPWMRNPTNEAVAEADSSVVLYDTVDGKDRFLEFSRFRGGDLAQWTARDCNIVDPYGDGLDAGASACDIAGMGLMLRAHELDPGYGAIRKAIGISLNAKTSPAQLDNRYVWPGKHVDAACGGGYACDGSIPYGQLFALPRTVDIHSLGLSDLGVRLAEMLRDYGWYAVDNGGRNVRTDQFVPSSTQSAMITAFRIIWPLMRAVLNNASTATQPTCSGGGEPIAPNGAFDA